MNKITVGELTEYWAQEDIGRESFNTRDELLYDNIMKNSSDYTTQYFGDNREMEEHLRMSSLLHDILVTVEDREVNSEHAYDEAVDIVTSYAPDMDINRQLGELRERFGGKTRFEVVNELDHDFSEFADNYPGAEPNDAEQWLENNGLRGFADLVEMDDGFKVKEFKTGKQRKRDRFQAANYAMIASIKAGKAVSAEVVYLPDYEEHEVKDERFFDVVDTWQSMNTDISSIKAEVQNDLQRHYGFVDESTLEDTVRALKQENDEEDVQEALDTLVEHEVRMHD